MLKKDAHEGENEKQCFRASIVQKQMNFKTVLPTRKQLFCLFFRDSSILLLFFSRHIKKY